MDYAENLTDRKIRMNYMRTILRNADRVLLYGEDDCIEVFSEYLSRYFYYESKSIYRIKSLDQVEMGSRDILMPLTTSYDTFINVLDNVCGNNKVVPLQVIPPGCFFLAALAEIKGFIETPNLAECQFPFLATIDMVDRCNLDCRTCGKITKYETVDRMDFTLFKAILDKLEIMGTGRIV